MTDIRARLALPTLLACLLAADSVRAASDPAPAQTACTNPSVFIIQNGKAADLCNVSTAGYLKLVIDQIIPLLLFIAVVILAYSGVQYMLGGISKDGVGKAKQRIIGTVTGVVFFVAISVILKVLANDITIAK